MKRITFWPQAWLGLTFNWAVLVAYTAKTGQITPSLLLLYAGLVFWTIGYDTIYACQDIEDDAMIGVKSTARLFGEKTKQYMLAIYILSASLIAFSVYQANPANYFLGVIPFAAHLLWQITCFNIEDGKACLNLFKSNRTAALLLITGFMLAKLL